MQEAKSKWFVVYSMKMCQYLIGEGFILRHVRKDEKNPAMQVFIFDNTPELQQAVSNFKNKKYK